MELSGIYDSGPMQPVFRVKDTVAVLSQGKYRFLIIDQQEPYPASRQTIVDMLSIAPAVTSIAASGGTVVKRVVQILQVNTNELIHMRFEPVDNIQGALYQPSGVSKFHPANLMCRVDRTTRHRDPYLSSTTFFVLGEKEDVNLETFNPMGVALPQARFQFWGDRNVVSDVELKGIGQDDLNLMQKGHRETVKKYLGVVTWVPAQGI